MKKFFLCFGIVAILALVFVSCKKESGDEEEDEDCEISVASIAGRYKLVSSKFLTGGGETDAISTLYEACELDDINELKADKTFTYTDGGTVCSPNGTTSGTWDVMGNTLKLNGGFSNIESFNCKNLVVTFRDENNNLVKETYVRQ